LPRSSRAHYVDRDTLQLVTEIIDTGVGMDNSKKRKLFKVFEHIKSKDPDSLESSTTGAGLGLYLSKQLSRYLKGDIDVESEPEKGTTVKIFFKVNVGSEQTVVEH